jgi:hypothetical protein
MTIIQIPNCLIEFGEFQDKLLFRVRAWLDNNCQKRWLFIRSDDRYFLELNSDEDAMLFTLTWL